jgi:8-oxo-dGTP diphosphatase
MLTVVAALISNKGRLLVCQRRRGDTFALQWEFPGGKVRAGEAHVAALERELEEELGARARIGPEIFRTRHSYRELTDSLELIFFTAQLDPGAVHNLAFEQMQWVEPEKLTAMNFLPADRELVAKLASGALHLTE